MDKSIFELQDVFFGYPGGALVFENLSLSFEQGKTYIIQGGSGMGKSTFLRLLCRFLEPTRGMIRFRTRAIREMDPQALRRQVSYVHQTPSFIAGSVKANLALPFTFKVNHHKARPTDDEMVFRLKQFVLDDVHLDQPAADLSLGQQQRLSLIRALLMEPDVLLLDEPISALDKENAQIVLARLKEGDRTGNRTLFIVSHQEIIPFFNDAEVLMIKNRALTFRQRAGHESH